jgi:hypothetical protein
MVIILQRLTIYGYNLGMTVMSDNLIVSAATSG